MIFRQGKHIGHAYIWPIMSEKFQWIHSFYAMRPSQEEITDPRVDKYLQCKDEQEYEIKEGTIYFQFSVILLVNANRRRASSSHG